MKYIHIHLLNDFFKKEINNTDENEMENITWY